MLSPGWWLRFYTAFDVLQVPPSPPAWQLQQCRTVDRLTLDCSCLVTWVAVFAQVLDNSPYKWLHEMLECFNHGDLHVYDALCSKHAAVLNAQPALVENERKLREKVCNFAADYAICHWDACRRFVASHC